MELFMGWFNSGRTYSARDDDAYKAMMTF
jgi:hypothetical protein